MIEKEDSKKRVSSNFFSDDDENEKEIEQNKRLKFSKKLKI